jgi:glycosyltransferase involved in cell wall biosynthesis
MKTEQHDRRVFFLSGGWVALRKIVFNEGKEPEGMPSVYRPWLRYKDHNYDVHVFYVDNFPNTIEFQEPINFHGVWIHRVRRPAFFQWRNRARYLKLRFPADLVILYLYASKVAKKFGAPCIVYSLMPWLNPVAWCLKRKFKAVSVHRVYGTWLYYDWVNSKNWIERLFMLQHFAVIKTPCDLMIISNDGTEGDRLAQLLKIPDGRVRMMLNGVSKDWKIDELNTSRLRQRLFLQKDDFVLLCLSRLSSWKRQDRVIDALPKVLTQVPSAHLVLAGDGPMRGPLARRAAELGVSEKVHFMGMIEHEQVSDYMGIADIFLQTNDLSCLGNSLLEAVICGRAIITWDVGTTRDLIKDGINGILLPRADPELIADTIIELYKDPGKRQELAVGARKYAIEHLEDWDQRLDREIKEVEALLAANGK